LEWFIFSLIWVFFILYKYDFKLFFINNIYVSSHQRIILNGKDSTVWWLHIRLHIRTNCNNLVIQFNNYFLTHWRNSSINDFCFMHWQKLYFLKLHMKYYAGHSVRCRIFDIHFLISRNLQTNCNSFIPKAGIEKYSLNTLRNMRKKKILLYIY
jgi:hypothetical protein